MLKSYFRIAWRSLEKNKTYSLLNIIGLAAGLTCFTFIALWVSDELSYDKFNEKSDRIVRLTGITKTAAGESASAVSSAPMARALMNDYAEVENTVRFDMHEEIVNHNQQQFLQPGILLTDPSFFDVFSYRLSQGNAAKALSEPFSIILTESTAKKYFGDTNPIGQTLTINMYDSSGYGAAYTITGIMPDPPQNAHFTFTMLGSFKTVETANPDVLTVDGWGDGSFYTYLLLKEGVDHRAFSGKISQFYAKYIGERYESWKSTYFYTLQPLADIHLRSNLQYEIAATGNINDVYIFSTIGIFILLLAGINYINLSMARAVNRAKEVGIKKAIGALKGQLIMQYMFEAVLTAFLALVVSLLISSLLQPLFFQLSGKELPLFDSGLLIFFLVGATLVLGILSGIYPATIISAFKPLLVLKGVFRSGRTGIALRKSLVVTQFIITLVLVTGIIVINSQMSFIKKKDLGYNKEALLFLNVHGNTDVIKGYEAFKNDLMTSSLVGGLTTSNSLPIGGLGTGGSETVDANDEPLQVNTARLRVDADYLNVYGIKLSAGRNFSSRAASDTLQSIILNEEAVRKIGWKDVQAAINKPFKMGSRQGVVIGVVKDFHFNSLQKAIEPLAIYPRQERFSRITVKADPAKAAQTISWIEKTWKKHFPSALLDYNFINRQVGMQYEAEERFSKIFLTFSFLSLLIACLGLFGLISYAAVQRTKEIGIRKTLGASVNRIAMMLSSGFLKLVALAFLVATPVTWYLMNSWLEHFVYRTTISWWMFAAAGLSVMLIALLTVGFQAIKAALANPVKSLRTE
ncbi:MAG: ABC transporter permease [Chitinophagaceae bacterium]